MDTPWSGNYITAKGNKYVGEYREAEGMDSLLFHMLTEINM